MQLPHTADAIQAAPGITVRQVAPSFAAEVAGVPIHGDVGEAQLDTLVDLLHRFRVLIVPEIAVTPGDLVAFSRRLGPLEIHSNIENTLRDHREVFCVGNVQRDGMKASFSTGVEQWHADSSFREVPSDVSLFYGEIVPPEGAQTMFADATAAYDALDDATKARIDGLRAVHSLETLHEWSLPFNPGRAPFSAEKRAMWPPISQDLVRTHPVTGAKSLYLCPSVISHIEGMDRAASQVLIAELMAHTDAPRFVYSHAWRRGDLVIWDNRAVLHTASLFDASRYQRLMYRTTVEGNSVGARAA
ncbi:TauD/TfdA family dioxygenase [Acidisphaera sp. L21]|uniref:TauD/TfdA dioxygenase family protein n=1 Tax=Acidisphaera sp. L21 TaxID=1641851 RepID=UPI00131D76E4|nr:TauD/TfdA family dioxygenase [Acidisphaera sp. L21]